MSRYVYFGLVFSILAPQFACIQESATLPESKVRPNQAGLVNLPFSLEHVGSIGADEGLSKPSSISPQPNGFFISDLGEKKVFFFNSKGEKISEFGRSGQGPGEFQKPLRVSSNDKHVFVYDINRLALITYTLDGTYISTLKLERAASHVLYSNDRFYFGFFHVDGKPDIEIRDTSGQLIKEIFLKGADDETYFPTMAIDQDGTLFASALNKYRVEIYTEKGEYQKSFDRPYQPLPFLPFPAFQLKIGIVPVSAITFYKDYVFVLFGGHQVNYEQLAKREVDEEYLMRIDVFTRKGEFLGYCWPKMLSKKMVRIHNTPIFHVSKDGRLGIQDPQDPTTVQIFQILDK